MFFPKNYFKFDITPFFVWVVSQLNLDFLVNMFSQLFLIPHLKLCAIIHCCSFLGFSLLTSVSFLHVYGEAVVPNSAEIITLNFNVFMNDKTYKVTLIHNFHHFSKKVVKTMYWNNRETSEERSLSSPKPPHDPNSPVFHVIYKHPLYISPGRNGRVGTSMDDLSAETLKILVKTATINFLKTLEGSPRFPETKQTLSYEKGHWARLGEGPGI